MFAFAGSSFLLEKKPKTIRINISPKNSDQKLILTLLSGDDKSHCPVAAMLKQGGIV
jgi:hypothetical protein